MTTYDASYIIGWIAGILVVIIGIPQVVYILRKKHVENVSILSWWGFLTAVLAFAILGIFISNDQLVYSELAAVIITIITMVLFVVYRKDIVYSNQYKLKTYLGLSVYFCLIITVVILHNLVKNEILSFGNFGKILGIIFSFAAPILATVSFLPQTISGITNKTLYNLPFGFLLILNGFNFFWSISFALTITAIDDGSAPKFLINALSRITFIFTLLFQLSSFAIAIIQFINWGIQIKKLQKPIIWI